MATLTQRLTALGTALVNRQVSDAEWLQLATALAAARGQDASAMTQAELAQLILSAGHELYIGALRAHEGAQAALAADSTRRAQINAAWTPSQ